MIDWGQVMLFRDNPLNISQKDKLMFSNGFTHGATPLTNIESIVFIHSLNLSLAPSHYGRLLLNSLMNAKRILVTT